jgi:lambda family phage minor tail protein L
MPRLLPPLFNAETSKEQQEIRINLLQIKIPNEAPMYFNDSNSDVQYQGVDGVTVVTYLKFPFKFAGVSLNSDGSISKSSLSVANVNRSLMDEVERNDGLRGVPITVLTLYEKFLVGGSSPSSVSRISEDFIIDSYQANEQTIQFALDPIVDLAIKIPRRRMTTDSCYWRFKDSETCGYVNQNYYTYGLVDVVQGSTVITASSGFYPKFKSNLSATWASFSILGDATLYTIVGFPTETTITISPAYAGSSSVDRSYAIKSASSFILATCDKTYGGINGCKAHGNGKMFGGFPGISGSRRISL